MKSMPVKLGEPIYGSHSSVLYTADALTPMESGNKLVQLAFAATALWLIVDDGIDAVLLVIGSTDVPLATIQSFAHVRDFS